MPKKDGRKYTAFYDPRVSTNIRSAALCGHTIDTFIHFLAKRISQREYLPILKHYLNYIIINLSFI